MCEMIDLSSVSDEWSFFCHLSLLEQEERITRLWLFFLAIVFPLHSPTEINPAMAEHSLKEIILYIMEC